MSNIPESQKNACGLPFGDWRLQIGDCRLMLMNLVNGLKALPLEGFDGLYGLLTLLSVNQDYILSNTEIPNKDKPNCKV